MDVSQMSETPPEEASISNQNRELLNTKEIPSLLATFEPPFSPQNLH